MTTPVHDKLTQPDAGREIARQHGKVRDATACPVCPTCQAEIAEGALSCEQCGATISTFLQGTKQRRLMSEYSFSLSSLMLWMTLSCLLLSLFAWEPLLGTLVFLPSVIAIPAMIRTLVITRKVIKAGKPLTTRMKIETFVVSLVVTIAAWGAFGFTSSFIGGLILIALSIIASPAAGVTPALLLLVIISAFIAGLFGFFYIFHILRDYSSIRY